VSSRCLTGRLRSNSQERRLGSRRKKTRQPESRRAARWNPQSHAECIYNFIKIHGTLRCTPAMAAGVTDLLWEVSDLVVLLEADERGLKKAA